MKRFLTLILISVVLLTAGMSASKVDNKVSNQKGNGDNPKTFVLEQNYPNPFNPETSIRFALKEDTKATLKVYNSLGAEIATLFDGTAEAGRYYDVKFGGSELASGFYIYKLVAGEYVSVKKMLLMK